MAMNAIKRNSYIKSLPSIFNHGQKRYLSSEEIQKRRSELFTFEHRRQREQVGRIEKIEVRYLGLPNDTTLIMNKGISTPFNCAQHLSDAHCKRSALALIDNTIPWDMHRPLNESCTIQLLNFTVADPHLANKSFWRTCSFMLGAVLKQTIKDEAGLQLHSFPSPNIKSGSFVHDISINLKSWEPRKDELRALSAEMINLASNKLKIERLEVHHDLALEMFKYDDYKREQLPSISRNGSVILYRVGNHVDISRGPMISSTGLLGRCTISSVHKVCDVADGGIYRVQGLALPAGIILNHVAYNILEERSKKLNPARLPNEPFEENVMENVIA